jgi:heptosyltransferase-2
VEAIKQFRKILVRVPNWVGDAVMCLPAMERIREAFPSSLITALARPWVAPVVEWGGSVDKVMIYDKSGWRIKDIEEMISKAFALRREGFDAAFLFQNAFEAAFLTLCAGIPERIGYNTDGRGFLLTKALPRKQGHMHQTAYYLAMLEQCGIEAGYKDPALRLPEEVFSNAWRRLEADGITRGTMLVGMGPGAVFGGAKRWPPERFSQVGKMAAAAWGARVLVLGSPSERGIADRVAGTIEGALNLCGSTGLTEAMGIIGCCSIFVTNDSGLMHVASALGVPTVAVFGPTDPVETGPLGGLASIVMEKSQCSPCFRKECPTDHRCMLAVSPERVFKEMERLISIKKGDIG